MRWFVILIVLIWSTAAQAEEQAHRIAFSEGRYSDAASAADVMHTPDNLAFAARGLLAKAMSAEDFIPPPDLIDQAEQFAREALIEAPEHIEARLQLAIALSLKTRPMTTRQTLRSGYGDEAKRLVESVLEDDPANVYAHGFLSVWHIEVRRRGGAIGASMLGASVKQGRKHYQNAVALSPDDASVHWQYARALNRAKRAQIPFGNYKGAGSGRRMHHRLPARAPHARPRPLSAIRSTVGETICDGAPCGRNALKPIRRRRLRGPCFLRETFPPQARPYSPCRPR